MKPDDVRRAAMLCDALDELPALRKALRKKPESGYPEVGLQLWAGSIDPGHGMSGGANFELDVETGETVLANAEQIIRWCLEELGVELPEGEGRR